MITLYELKGRDDRRYSLFSWRSRMALRHKGLAFETRGVCLSDKAAIDFSGGHTVPVLRDGDTVISDSWAIAEHLEQRYALPPLFGGAIGRGVTLAFNTWVDRAVVRAMLPVIAPDVHERVHPADEQYFRDMAERATKKPLPVLRAERRASLDRLRSTVEPMQAALKRQPFVCGASAAYADYILFSVFQWARMMSPEDVLGAEEPLRAWRERMLDLFDGYAREVPDA